jgi:uncharacterized membrane protein
MSSLVAIVYDDAFRAPEAMKTLSMLEREHLVEVEDACWVSRNENGELELHPAVYLSGAATMNGAFWGTLIGALFAAPIAGMALGAAAGALIGKPGKTGLGDEFVRSISEKVKPGSSAIFMLGRSLNPEKVGPQIAKFGGTLLSTNLPEATEQMYQSLLDRGEKAGIPGVEPR